jgi:hypothetical protein
MGQELIPVPGEVLFPESGLQHRLQEEVGERRKRVAVDLGGHSVHGTIVPGGGVRVGAEALEDLVVGLRRIPIGPSEHHVLEEVRETAVARFDLVA